MIINGGRLKGATFQDQQQYITANLVENWDAAYYTGSGTSWPSSVNNPATLVNSPAYTASNPTYFSLNPASLQYATAPNIGTFNIWTIEAWFRPQADLSAAGPNGLTSIITTVFDNEISGYTGQINFTLTNYNGTGATNGIAVGFYNSVWNLTSPFTTTPGTWYQVVGTFDGTTLSQYNNGTLGNAITAIGASSSNSGAIMLGRRWDGAVQSQWLFPGDIAIVRLYNTALSSEQVAQNFNSTRGRFGL